MEIKNLIPILLIIGTLGQFCQAVYYPYHTFDNFASDGITRRSPHSPVSSSPFPYYSSVDLLRLNNNLYGHTFRESYYDRPYYGNNIGSTFFGSGKPATPFHTPTISELVNRLQHGYHINQSDLLRARVNIELARLMHLIRLERQMYSVVGQASDDLLAQVIIRILKSSENPASTSVSKQRLDQLRSSLLHFLFPNTQLVQDLNSKTTSSSNVPITESSTMKLADTTSDDISTETTILPVDTTTILYPVSGEVEETTVRSTETPATETTTPVTTSKPINSNLVNLFKVYGNSLGK